MRLSVNISTVYRGISAPEAIRRAKRDGFAAIEIQTPYDTAIADLGEALEETGLPLVLINLPFKQGGGEDGVDWPAITAGAEDAFKRGVERASRYVEAFDIPAVNALAGIPAPGEERAAVLDRYYANLDYAQSALASLGSAALVEPVSSNDLPGFLFHTCADAIAAIDATGGGRRLQFDVYHLHQMEADAVAAFDAHVGRIGHVQFADWPGRGAPGTGEIDFARWFARLAQPDYQGIDGRGWAGAEYNRDPEIADQQAWLGRFF